MISEDDVQRAVDYLRDSANQAAQARAEVEYLAEWRKVVLAQETLKSGAGSVAAQEAFARTTDAYTSALTAYKAAVEADARHRFLRAAAEAKIQAWQTMSANERATRI